MDTSRIHNTMDNLSQLLGYTTPDRVDEGTACRKSALLIFKNILSICAQSTRANWGSRFQRKLYVISTGRST